ncbi:putative RNA-binding protein EIF1AD [Brevipalpus obovatus]|uniref:putative RNA-binding protein EIF1AD n=1 Tax=Brevipalpus obovatus TaxID=246614 RepID=UPI003D9E6ED6
MSKITKRKYVTQEVMDNLFIPEEPCYIVKVIAGRGNNLHEIETPDGQRYLASMPTKFRRNVWIKRGNYVVVEPIEEGDKVKAEIVQILLKDQIKYIKGEGKWPPQFEEPKGSGEKDDQAGDEFELPNPNRVTSTEDSEEDSESSSESDTPAEPLS